MVLYKARSGALLSILQCLAVQADNFSPGGRNKCLLAMSQGLHASLGGAFRREDIILKVSLVGDVPSWGVSGHHKGGTI